MISSVRFTHPPIVEMALGVQFDALRTMRAVDLGTLRENWRNDYPRVEEQPALQPVIERDSPWAVSFQLNLLVPQMRRYWFLNESGSELVQVQPDRLTVNWRRADPSMEYPRYGGVRSLFERRFLELRSFVQSAGFGELKINQVEITYLDMIEVDKDHLGHLENTFSLWRGTNDPVLGHPEVARASVVYRLYGVGQDPTRLYASIEPGVAPATRQPTLQMTYILRGAPETATLEDALRFMDRGHDQVTKAFLHLTTDSLHTMWGMEA